MNKKLELKYPHLFKFLRDNNNKDGVIDLTKEFEEFFKDNYELLKELGK